MIFDPAGTRLPVQPVEVIQSRNGDDGLVRTDVGWTVKLAADIGFRDDVGVESVHEQAMRMAERPDGDVEPGETRRHLRAIAADASQMDGHAFVQQALVDSMGGCGHDWLRGGYLHRP